MRALSAACSEVRIARKYKKRSGGASRFSLRGDIITSLRYPVSPIERFTIRLQKPEPHLVVVF